MSGPRPPPTLKELGFVALAVLICGVAFAVEGKATKGSGASRTMAAVGFMACSGSLLLVNKLAVFHLQLPSTLVAAQLGFTAAAIGALGRAGALEVVPADAKTLRAFLPVAGAFLATVCLSTKILQYANVEAMIVIRASALIPVAVLDFFCLGAMLSARSILSLVLLIGTVVVHVSLEKIKMQASFWMLVWYGVFLFDQIYIKHMVSSVKLPAWSNAFYTNLLSGLLVLPLVAAELYAEWPFVAVDAGGRSLVIVLGSCLLGLAMSYFSFSARAAFSATYFTLLGNVCKLLTIVMNNLVWTHHAGIGGTVACIAAVGSAYLFQDSPKPAPEARPKRSIVPLVVVVLSVGSMLFGGWQFVSRGGSPQMFFDRALHATLRVEYAVPQCQRLPPADASSESLPDPADASSESLPDSTTIPPSQRLRILYADHKAVEHGKYRYYWDFLLPLKNMHTLCHFRGKSHMTVLTTSPFESGNCAGGTYDVLVIGMGVFSDWIHFHQEQRAGRVSSFLPWMKDVTIPVVVMLSKEYQLRDSKLSWIREHQSKIVCGFTVDHKWRDYERETSVPFSRLPFAVNHKDFDLLPLNPNYEYEYDIGFTGHVNPQLQRGNWRGRILQEVKPKLEKSGVRFFHRNWTSPAEYTAAIAKTKIWLTSLSSGDLVGTRYFEIMASGTTVLLCNREEGGAYEDMGFEDGVNLLMYDSLDEFFRKVMQLSGSCVGSTSKEVEAGRRGVVQRARQLTLRRHTYDRRGELWTEVVLQKLRST